MANRIIRCTVSSKSIKRAIEELNTLEDKLKIAEDTACRRIAHECADLMWDRQNSFLSSNKEASGYNSTSHVIQLNDRYIARIEGDQVIYNEFGTGDPGLNNPHPNKSKYDLNPYLSGKYIKTDIDGGHYWIHNGDAHIGVPAGKFVYSTVNDIKSKIGRKILKEEVDKALKSGGGDDNE